MSVLPRLLIVVLLSLGAQLQAVSAEQALFASSFEPLGKATIDVASRSPAPGSYIGLAQAVPISARFVLHRRLPAGMIALSIDGVDVT